MSEGKTKTCPKCEQTLVLEAFYRVAARKDGHASWCKKCSNEARKSHKKSTKRPEYNLVAEFVLKEGKPRTCPSCKTTDVPSHKMRGRMENGEVKWDCVQCRMTGLAKQTHITLFCDWCCEPFDVPPSQKDRRFCGPGCLCTWRNAVRVRALRASHKKVPPPAQKAPPAPMVMASLTA